MTSKETFSSKISRFIPEYPSITSDTFQKDLASKKEFYQLKLTSQSDAYQEGKKFKVYENGKFVTHDILKHQEMAARFISPYAPYREMLIWDDPGTGKSLLVAHVVENFKKIITGELKKRALVIAPPSVRPNLYKEFALLYDEEINSQKNINLLNEQREYKKKAMVDASYEMQTPELFAKRIIRMTDSDIIKIYSNSLIIIDEVHHIPGMKPETKKQQIDVYRIIHKFLHLLQPHGVRILLLTATPIQDKTHEIAAIMNLILPMNMQLPTGAAFNKRYISSTSEIINQDELITYFRGRVSHVRASLTDAKIIEIGTPLSNTSFVNKKGGTSMIVDRSKMSEFQSAIVKKTYDDAENRIKKVKTTKKEVLSAFHADERQASNFVFPDGSYGMEGFNKYCVKKIITKITKTFKNGNTRTISKEKINYSLNSELLNALDTNGIEYYSAKFAKIIDDAIKNPTHVRFIFCESILGSGAILLALLFRYKKFKWLENSYTSSDLRNNSAYPGNVVVIGTDAGAINSSSKITQLIKDMKSEENVNGDRVQIVIGGRKIALGLSFMNVREIDIVMPPWDISILEQAMYRGLRFGSHKWIPEKERIVNIRKHVSIYQTDSKLTSPDENIYLLAEKKDIQDAPVYRLLKIAAVDCPLNYNRNVLKTDIDGTRVCNYTICNYKCDTFPPTSITKIKSSNLSLKEMKEIYNYDVKNPTTETYNLYYNKADIKNLIHNIHLIFRKYFTLTFDQLKILTDTKDSYLLLEALDSMIGNSELVYDMYGTVCILQEYKNIYYISSISSSDHYASLYNRFPMIWQTFNLDDIRRKYGYVCDSKLLKNKCKTLKTDPSLIDELSWDGAVSIYENMFIYNMKSPLTGIKKKIFDLLQKRLGKDEIFKIKINDTVSYIHNLYSSEFTGISYGVKSQSIKSTGKLRLYVEASKSFEDVSVDKEIEYLSKIKRKKSISTKMKEPIYGSIQKKDGKFRIHDNRKGKAVQGLVCDKGGTKLEYIASILDDFKWDPQVENSSYKDMNEEELKSRIKSNSYVSKSKKTQKYLDSLNHESLLRMLHIYSMSKTELCNSLRLYFEQNNLMSV
jgi:hypothetical protein